MRRLAGFWRLLNHITKLCPATLADQSARQKSSSQQIFNLGTTFWGVQEDTVRHPFEGLPCVAGCEQLLKVHETARRSSAHGRSMPTSVSIAPFLVHLTERVLAIANLEESYGGTEVSGGANQGHISRRGGRIAPPRHQLSPQEAGGAECSCSRHVPR